MADFPWYRIVDIGRVLTGRSEGSRGMVSANGLMFGEDEPPQYQPGVKGPYFVAGFGSPCSQGDWICDGEVIRADGDGGWEHQTCTNDEPMGGWAAIFDEPTPAASARFQDHSISNRRVLAQRQEARAASQQYFGFADAMETNGIDRATVTFTPEGLAVFPEKPIEPEPDPAEPTEHERQLDQYERIATALSEHPYWTPEPRDYEPDHLISVQENGTTWVYAASQWREILAHYEAANGINRNDRPE